jgi:predicted kinase
MIRFKQFLNEGINDPAIFKAVFLAGGPGSGKSFVVGKTGLTALGLKLINSDPAFEKLLTKAGLKMTPDDIFSPKGQDVRIGAKKLTGKQRQRAIEGRLGLVIDGTGKDHSKIKNEKDRLEGLGYETKMIFVDTNLQTALDRNQMRPRSLPDDEVTKMWNNVQKNKDAFVRTFGQKDIEIVNNSTGQDIDKITTGVYKKISAWTKSPVNNAKAKEWIAGRKKIRGISEEVTQKQLQDLEKFGDRILAKFGVDIEFTKHFADRMNDDRNKPAVKVQELQQLFKRIARNKAKNIRQNPDSQAVIKDMQNDLNLPVVINYDKNKDEFEVINKTIMRKKNFSTSNKVLNI